MSEFQIHEFQAIDRALSAQEQAKLRTYSSRATITPSRFAVTYSYGDFKGNAVEWMERYFDAYLYMANWGTNALMLGFPSGVLSLDLVKQYCVGESAWVRAKGSRLILSFGSELEDGGEWLEEESGILASLLPLRAELAGGDLRALYLAWLACVDVGELEEGDTEPPCPPGLGELSPALEALAEFLRLDPDLIDAATEASPPLSPLDDGALEAWVSALPSNEKTTAILRLMRGEAASVQGALLRAYRDSHAARSSSSPVKPRTVGDLVASAHARTEERRRRQEARDAREKARQAKLAAEVRERHLAALSRRETEAWREVDVLISTKLPRKYDEAVVLLGDLRDLCTRDGRTEEATRRLAILSEAHAKKPALIKRFQKAALI
jgi:hypothetical protein